MEDRYTTLQKLLERRRNLEDKMIDTACAKADKAWLGRLLAPKEVLYTDSVIDRLKKELSAQEELSKNIVIYSKAFLASLRAETRLLAGPEKRFDEVAHTDDLIETFVELADRGASFVDGPRMKRLDALGKEMNKAFSDFFEKHGKMPTARELWNAIPVVGKIQEKHENVIWWENAKSVEKSTSFKTFQNRITPLKKKFEKMQK